jgi:hypothetical protein
LYLGYKGDCMGHLIDQADKSTSNYQALLDLFHSGCERD